MKKLLLLSLISGALISTNSYAQGSGPAPTQQAPAQLPTAEQMANMVKEAKAKQTPLMVEKTGLTTAQADRVIEINFEVRQQIAAAIQGLSDADRSAKIAEFKAVKEKRYLEIPLTTDQVKAVYSYYEDMAKNPPKRD